MIENKMFPFYGHIGRILRKELVHWIPTGKYASGRPNYSDRWGIYKAVEVVKLKEGVRNDPTETAYGSAFRYSCVFFLSLDRVQGQFQEKMYPFVYVW